MLFRKPILDGIAAGRVTLAFRRWAKPASKAGGRQRTRVGVLQIEAVDRVEPEALTEDDARDAGYSSLEKLRQTLPGDEPLWRIRFRLAGPDPRIALREDADLTPQDRQYLRERLDRLDRASRRGPWTRQTLQLIAERPATRAPDLAASQGLETLPFKRDVRKLKELGLTESLDVGYRLSPRGRAFLQDEG